MKRTILICLMVGTLLLAFTQTPHVRAQEATPYGQADQETYIHVVVKGDTLWDISRRYGVTVADITNWNELRGKMIKPGHKLKIRSVGL